MPVKVLILGRPGSGKSAAARQIKDQVKHRGRSSVHINDYAILQEKFLVDDEQNIFIPVDFGGFDVIDFTVLDIALQEVRDKAHKHISSSQVDLIIIEFARADYRKALEIFVPNFLRDAYFLYLDADLDTCIDRVYERTAHPTTPDDYYISDRIIRTYYQIDNRPYMSQNFAKDHNVDANRVKIIENMGSLQEFVQEINEFVEFLFEQEPSLSRQTDPIQIVPIFISDTELTT
jgi:adenylate kinase family enzyme